jgi:tRNA(adenine34) deaminase
MRASPCFSVVIYAAMVSASIALPPTPLAFTPSHGRLHHVPSRTRGKEPSTTVAHVSRRRGGFASSMPPLCYTNSTIPRRGNIFRILKRDVYPTIDFPFDDGNYTTIDHYFMGLALQQAQHAWDRGEVPIGAVVVRECTPDDAMEERRGFQIISVGHNRVETNVDASAHAELLALRQGAWSLQNWRFPPNSRLYTTLEPCPMCLSSIQAFRIDHVVYGSTDNRLGAIKTHMELLSVVRHPYHEVKSVTGGVRAEECGDIVVQFFRKRRRMKKKAQGDRGLLKLPLGRTSRNNTEKQSNWLKTLLRLK